MLTIEFSPQPYVARDVLMNDKNSLSMGTIAVTGATGYLAEKLIERLITQGHTIHAIARNEGN